jgi:hypothetical protein
MDPPVQKTGFVKMPERIEIKKSQTAGKQHGPNFQTSHGPTRAAMVAGGWTQAR